MLFKWLRHSKPKVVKFLALNLIKSETWNLVGVVQWHVLLRAQEQVPYGEQCGNQQ